MARLHHTVTVVAPDRELLDAYAAVALELAGSTRARGQDIVLPDGRAVPGLALVRGRHLRPGARYEHRASGSGSDSGSGSQELEATVIREWRRDAIAVEQLLRSPELSGRMALRLRNPARPESLKVEGRVRGSEGSGSMLRMSGRASLDLAAWWAAAALAPGAPPVARAPATARLKHRLGIARLYLRPRRAEPGPVARRCHAERARASAAAAGRRARAAARACPADQGRTGRGVWCGASQGAGASYSGAIRTFRQRREVPCQTPRPRP